ncbi:MAG: DUF2071 domain-containing protein [Acidobacteria bacterium]|jgi:uncharacterized protein YqjF (DUF2071 family)|nr:DUF2071 domain-containing protein [Acidobacteriota bacterium]
MKIPTLQGIIKRRILVNYRAEPEAIRKILPPRFRPKLHEGRAIAGICLIRLEHIRPKYAPEFVGISSENAAHRIAVFWEDENGETKEGVFIPRRDTNSFINHFAGGTLFPGEHYAADFSVTENGREIDFAMRSKDGTIEVKLTGEISKNLPDDSIFSSIAEASTFFEKGSLGYSVTKNGQELDGITLKIKNWKVEALNLDSVKSNYYENENIFPKDSIEFDHALLMRNIKHEWHSAPGFELK